MCRCVRPGVRCRSVKVWNELTAGTMWLFGYIEGRSPGNSKRDVCPIQVTLSRDPVTLDKVFNISQVGGTGLQASYVKLA